MSEEDDDGREETVRDGEGVAEPPEYIFLVAAKCTRFDMAGYEGRDCAWEQVLGFAYMVTAVVHKTTLYSQGGLNGVKRLAGV